MAGLVPAIHVLAPIPIAEERHGVDARNKSGQDDGVRGVIFLESTARKPCAAVDTCNASL
jgi:hypothetical protein